MVKSTLNSNQSSRRFTLRSILIGMMIIPVTGFLGYSVYSYQTSSQEKEGFITCNADKSVCELSQHIHADIELTVCGTVVQFPKEKGNTTLQHTHKETNKIHWHAPIKIDPITHTPQDPSVLQISAFFEQMEYSLPQTCPQNANPTTTIKVNGLAQSDALKYTWKDGDVIVIDHN